jgi:hypothetical protein
MRRLLTYSAVTALLLGIAAAGLYLWVSHHAAELVRALLRRESGGTVDIRVGRVGLDIRGHRLTLTDNRFTTPEGRDINYGLSAERITLVIGPWRRLLLDGRVDIDTVRCDAPALEIVRSRPGPRRDLSIPEEVARVYRILDRTLGNLRIRQFAITDGRLTLRKGFDSAASPVVIDHIRLTLDDIRPETGSARTGDWLRQTSIRLETDHQDLRLPDGRRRIRFAKLRLDSREQRISADTVTLLGEGLRGAVPSFRIDIDRIDILGADLPGLAREDVIRADSALCLHPSLRLQLRLNGTPRTRSEAGKRELERSFSELVGHLDIRHIGIRDASADLRADRNGRPSQYSTRSSDLTLRDVRALAGKPLHIGGFDIRIREYLGYSSDSLYAIRFDSIRLQDRVLALGNFSIQATPRHQGAEWREVRMRALELDNVYWPDLVYRERFVADAARLVQPTVEITLPAPGRMRRKGTLYLALNGFRRTLSMDRLQLQDADVVVRAANGAALRMDGFDTEVDITRLLGSDDATDLIGSVRGFSFADGELRNTSEQILLHNGRYDGRRQHLTLDRASYGNRRDPLAITALGMTLTGAERTPDNRFKAADVSWQQAEIVMNRTGRPKHTPTAENPLLIGWNSTHGRNTTLTLEQGSLYLTTRIDSLRSDTVLIPTQGKPRIDSLQLEGRHLLLASRDTRAEAAAYRLRDRQPSRLSDLSLNMPAGDRRLKARIPGLQLTPDLGSFIDDRPALSDLHIEAPRLEESTPDPSPPPAREPGRLPVITIDNIHIEDAAWTGTPGRLPGNGPLRFDSADIRLANLRSDGRTLTIEQLQADLLRPRWTDSRTRMAATADAPVRITLSDISRTNGQGPTVNSARLDHLRIPRLDMQVGQADRLQADSAELSGIHLHDGMRTDAKGFLADQPGLTLATRRLAWDNPARRASLHGLHYVNVTRHLQADSTHLSPVLDREAYTRLSPFQKDHVSLHTGTLTASAIDPAAALSDTLLRARHITIDRPALAVYRDRTLPRRTGRKPLPAEFAASLPLPLHLDTLDLHDGTIHYTERRPGTPTTAQVTTRQTHIRALGIQSRPTAATDTLRITIDTRLQEAVNLRLRYHEAATDTLHGFLLALRTGPFALPALNSILEPMASARMRRGYVDTIDMKAAGNDISARNAMRMRYRDLKLQFLNPGDTAHKTLRIRLKNLLANTLLRRVSIRSAAAVRTDRDPDRGFLNYWVRMTLHGVLANAGIRIGTLQERGKGRKRQQAAGKDIPDLLGD